MKFRKKPVVIEAVQFLLGEPIPRGVCVGWMCNAGNQPHVHTVHNGQHVMLENGDWVIGEPDGVHYYPVKNDIFEATYEPV